MEDTFNPIIIKNDIENKTIAQLVSEYEKQITVYKPRSIGFSTSPYYITRLPSISEILPDNLFNSEPIDGKRVPISSKQLKHKSKRNRLKKQSRKANR